MTRILILGGTSEAGALAAILAGHPTIDASLSLAGRTQNPGPAPIPTRRGGFGGAEGLAAYLRTEAIGVVVDATHPFAERISQNAARACAATATPLLVLTRPPWARVDGDRWISAADMAEAAQKLRERRPARVFLTIGRQQLAAFAGAPDHVYLIRAIEPMAPPLPHHAIVLARPPFSVEDEEQLMRARAIEILVTKNSGGAATYAKIVAARRLGLPVLMIERPAPPDARTFSEPGAVLAAIEVLRGHTRLPWPGTRTTEK